MKALYSFYPGNSSDSDITITGSTATSGYPLTNLKNPKPGILYKTSTPANPGDTVYVRYQIGAAARPYNCIFLNRINFSEFYIDRSSNGSDWTEIVHVTGLTRDEIYAYDPTNPTGYDQYVHYFYDNTSDLNYEYIRIRIPYQVPIFGTDIQIGQILIGKYVDIWGPKAGFSINYIPKINLIEFDSGHIDKYRLGKTRRMFSCTLDKMSSTEYNKVLLTFAPFVLYVDFNGDPTQAYFVRASKEFSRVFEMVASNATVQYNLEEII